MNLITHYERGLLAGLKGKRPRNPWPKWTEAHDDFQRGLEDGLDVRQQNVDRKPEPKGASQPA